jgi:16S rRNA (adenine1518-N6/adenine1519-N6)-dimethyltransferase
MKIHAKKSLGQNFLKDKSALRKIVEVSEIGPDDVVLEICPGKGALTSFLLQSGARVLAVEKDHRLIPELQERFENQVTSGQLEIIEGDILEMDAQSLFQNLFHVSRAGREAEFKTQHYRLVANIPYYITGQILRNFLETEYQPRSMTLMVQKEVAERIVARDGKESILSLSVKAFGTPRYVQTVAAKYFSPAPSVDSAILYIGGISQQTLAGQGISAEIFFTYLKTGFAGKRKQLAKNLSALHQRSEIESALADLDLPKQIRAEDMNIDQWLLLIKKLQ